MHNWLCGKVWHIINIIRDFIKSVKSFIKSLLFFIILPPKSHNFLGKLIGKYIKVLVFFFFGDIHQKEITTTGHYAENGKMVDFWVCFFYNLGRI